MESNHEKQEKGESLLSSALVCCVPALRHRPASYQETMNRDSINSAVIYHEPQPAEPTMEFEPAPKTRPRTAISLALSTSSTKRRRLTKLPPAPRTPGTPKTPRTLSLSAISRRPWTSHGEGQSRPRISGPMDFRRVEDATNPPPRVRFRPIELSIYMPQGRLSPLPDFRTDEWDFKPVDLSVPKPAVVREWDMLEDETARVRYPLRSNPVSNSLRDLAQRASSAEDRMVSVQNGPGPILRDGHVEMSASAVPHFDDDMPVNLPVTLDEIGASTSRPRTSSSSRPRTLSRSGSPELTHSHSHSRSITDMVRPFRTSGSIRRIKASEAVDEEIRELNTIVEERRASALQKNRGGGPPVRKPSRPTQPHHVPAVAPSMKLRARSETLSDIGSAFSVPLSGSTVKQAASVSSPGYGTPLSSPPLARTKSSRTSKLRTWFSRSSVRESNAPTSPPPQQVFYQCEQLPDEPYSLASSPTISTGSTYADYSDDESSPADSYPARTSTALTTPQSFSPVRELENDTYTPASESLRSKPSVSKRGVRRVPAFPKRGLSVDTTMTTSSVGTSILGASSIRGHAAAAATYEAEPLPTREPAVGVAF